MYLELNCSVLFDVKLVRPKKNILGIRVCKMENLFSCFCISPYLDHFLMGARCGNIWPELPFHEWFS